MYNCGKLSAINAGSTLSLLLVGHFQFARDVPDRSSSQ